MVCDECREEPATVHVTRIVNNQKTELHLCADCAKARGESLPVEPGFAFHNILAGLFDEGSPVGRRADQAHVRCENCGLTLADFRRLGQLGCSHCYQQFQKELEPLLRRVHRGVEHVGKRPGEPREASLQREIQRLRTQLDEAVEREAFEEAARLRDRIKELEAKTARASKTKH